MYSGFVQSVITILYRSTDQVHRRDDNPFLLWHWLMYPAAFINAYPDREWSWGLALNNIILGRWKRRSSRLGCGWQRLARLFDCPAFTCKMTVIPQARRWSTRHVRCREESRSIMINKQRLTEYTMLPWYPRSSLSDTILSRATYIISLSIQGLFREFQLLYSFVLCTYQFVYCLQ